LTQEVEVGAAVHLALKGLQARDLPLAPGAAPRPFEHGPDGGVVGLDAAGECAQVTDGADSGGSGPGVETLASLGPDESDGGRDSVVHVG